MWSHCVSSELTFVLSQLTLIVVVLDSHIGYLMISSYQVQKCKICIVLQPLVVLQYHIFRALMFFEVRIVAKTLLALMEESMMLAVLLSLQYPQLS